MLDCVGQEKTHAHVANIANFANIANIANHDITNQSN
jgi:hypothetical protein